MPAGCRVDERRVSELVAGVDVTRVDESLRGRVIAARRGDHEFRHLRSDVVHADSQLQSLQPDRVEPDAPEGGAGRGRAGPPLEVYANGLDAGGPGELPLAVPPRWRIWSDAARGAKPPPAPLRADDVDATEAPPREGVRRVPRVPAD